MIMRNGAAALALAVGLSGAFGWSGLAAQESVSNLRLVQDASGTPLEAVPAPPGEKLFHLDQGVDQLFMAFDVDGSTPAEVQVRVTGPMGVILYQEAKTVEQPGTQVMVFDNKGVPLEDNEYVVNAYVGKDLYLADSLQLTIGAATLPTSAAEPTSPAEVPQPTLAAAVSDGAAAPGVAGASTAMPGPSRQTLALAIAGMVALFGIVVWAGWSAMRRR